MSSSDGERFAQWLCGAMYYGIARLDIPGSTIEFDGTGAFPAKSFVVRTKGPAVRISFEEVTDGRDTAAPLGEGVPD